MRAAIIEWGRVRWRGMRAMHEIACGRRRTDLVFVCERDLIAFEIKSSVDNLSRLEDQVTEFGRYFPEVWIAIAPRWQSSLPSRLRYGNVIIVNADVEPCTVRVLHDSPKWRPTRDELVYSRLLELLWMPEAQAIAQRTDVIPGAPTKQMRRATLPMLARLLTGNEILTEVCRELRARMRFSATDDPPMRGSA